MGLFTKMWAACKEFVRYSAVQLDSVTTPGLKKTWEGSVSEARWRESCQDACRAVLQERAEA
jgi:hypothetical protein